MSTTRNLHSFLTALVTNKIMDPVMIWGAPGIGKSGVVAQVAKEKGLAFIDLRISQMMPGDLRGLPAADIPNNSFKYLPPNCLPKPGCLPTVVFLDELTQAPPAVQAITQQLVLDRRVGDYVLPDNVFVWAAGNRQEDKTGVFSMPTALANRFNHVDVVADYDTWKLDYGVQNMAPEIVSFLALRPTLLHNMNVKSTAWPSPRSWSLANRLFLANLDIEHAVGGATAAEFTNYLVQYKQIPDIDKIVAGKGASIKWPREESLQFAVTVSLLSRTFTCTGSEILNYMIWMAENAAPEYTSKLIEELFHLGLNKIPQLDVFMASLNTHPKIKELVGRVTGLNKLANAN
jgi:hypothetical protein